jgi:YbbR domain-containing protein
LQFDKVRRLVTENIGAKIISLLFAVFLWLHVTAQQQEAQSFRVPLTLTGIPDSLTIIHEVPKYVEITVKGDRSSLIKLRLFGRLKASIDLSTVKQGRINIPLLSSAVLNLSEELDPRNVTVDSPKALNLNFERVIAKSVPVKIAYRGEIPKDVIITGSPVVIPDRIKIIGAASLLGSINFLTTEEVDIRNKRGKIAQEVGLELGGRKITVTPDKVLVEMEVSKRAVRTLANIPPTLLQDDEALLVEYAPRVVSLTIEGPEEIIKTIVAEDVSIILNITMKKPGTYRIDPEVIIPSNIEKYWLDIDSFEITILPPGKEGSGSGEEE